MSRPAMTTRRKRRKESKTRQSTYFSNQFQPAHDWHIHIGENQTGLQARLRQVQCCLTAFGGFHLKSVHGQTSFKAHRNSDRVVDDENGDCLGRSSRPGLQGGLKPGSQFGVLRPRRYCGA
jgi:hypothetical protein